MVDYRDVRFGDIPEFISSSTATNWIDIANMYTTVDDWRPQCTWRTEEVRYDDAMDAFDKRIIDSLYEALFRKREEEMKDVDQQELMRLLDQE